MIKKKIIMPLNVVILKSLSIVAILISNVGFSQEDVIDTRVCSKIGNIEQRLSCYDRLQPVNTRSLPVTESASEVTENLTEASALVSTDSNEVSVAPLVSERQASNSIQVEESKVDAFGAGGTTESQARIELGDNGEEELIDTISQLKLRGDKKWLITLTSGQVWLQEVGGRPYRLKVGHTVRIYPSRWGSSFRLSANEVKGFIQVKRVN